MLAGQFVKVLEQDRERMEAIFWVPFCTYGMFCNSSSESNIEVRFEDGRVTFSSYGMFHTVACHFLKFSILSSSRNKARVETEGGFSGYPSGPIGCSIKRQVNSWSSLLPDISGGCVVCIRQYTTDVQMLHPEYHVFPRWKNNKYVYGNVVRYVHVQFSKS